jgi:hypothetical protein
MAFVVVFVSFRAILPMVHWRICVTSLATFRLFSLTSTAPRGEAGVRSVSSIMVSGDPNAKRPWEGRVSEAAARVEQELRNLVRAVDDEVVPEIRKHGSAALRMLATKLERAAQSMDDEAAGSGRNQPPRNQP